MSPSFTFSSDVGVTRRFLLRMGIAALAAAALLGAGIWGLLVRSNESYLVGLDGLLRDESILWGPLLLQNTPTYKLHRALMRRPHLLYLGSSRTTQFRDAMTPGVRAYNASLAASSMEDALAFVRTLFPRHKPSVTLLGIDSWWFETTRAARGPANGLVDPDFSAVEQVANLIREVSTVRFLFDLVAQPASRAPDPLGGRRPVGYNASATASGFRPDGSHQYGAILLDRFPLYHHARMGFAHGFGHSVDQVRRKSGRFAYVGEPSVAASAALREIIRLHRENGVKLVLFFPSFAHAVFAEIEAQPEQRRFFADITRTVRDIAAAGDVEFFDYHDLARLGVSDAQTIDGIHADEIGTFALIRDLAARSAVLQQILPPAARADMARLAAASAEAGPHRLVR